MAHPFSTVLFDFDDTLADSYGAIFLALQAAFSQSGIRSVTAEQFLRDLRGTQLVQTLAQLEAREGRRLDLLGQYERAYWLKEPGLISLFPGVKAVLHELHRGGLKLGIVTQKRRALQIDGHQVGLSMELQELGIAELFSVSIGFEDVTNYKPHPEAVLMAMERLGASPQETLVVGDSLADIEAARAAGCRSRLAAWGLPPEERELSSRGADLVAEAPEALLELVFPGAGGIIKEGKQRNP